MHPQPNATPVFWWQMENEDDAAKAMFELARQLDDDQGTRSTDLRYWLSLYLNRNLASMGGPDALAIIRGVNESERLTLNVAESCVDTVANRLALNKPKPFFATSAGSWEEKQRAKKANEFMDGLFYQCRVHDDITPAVRLDALWSGSGIAKAYEEDDKAKVMWVHPLDLTVDPGEAKHGKPRSIYERAVVSRSVLMALFPERADLIVNAVGPEQTDAARRADLVLVREGWHLPSGGKKKDGKHVIAVSTGCLNPEETEWDDEEFPFEVVHYKKRPVGFWGGGLVEELAGIQRELTYTAQKIQRLLKMNTSRTFLRRQAKIPRSSVDNSAGALIEVDDPTDLKTVADNAVPSEFFAHLDRLYEMAFQKAGVSMLAATGKKPAGLDSAVAQREYNDTTNERFAKFLSNDEKFHVGLGRKLLRIVRRIAERNKGSYEVQLPSKGKLKVIDWKDVCLDEEKALLQCLPVSALPTLPAYRQQTVQEWIAAGWVTPEEGRALLDFPDLQHSTNLATAALEDIDATISAILDDGRFTDPEPYQFSDAAATQQALRRFTSAYLKARLDGAPEDRLQMMREWIDKATEMVATPPPATSATPPPMPGDMSATTPVAPAPMPSAAVPGMPPGVA